MNKILGGLVVSLLGFCSVAHARNGVEVLRVEERQWQVPLVLDQETVYSRIAINRDQAGLLTAMSVSAEGLAVGDVAALHVYFAGKDSTLNWQIEPKWTPFGKAKQVSSTIQVNGRIPLDTGVNYLFLSIKLDRGTGWKTGIRLLTDGIWVTDGVIQLEQQSPVVYRTGVAVRKHLQDGVHTSRIPGVVTTNNGTLLAIFDARYESARDLQGHMDIGLHRSTDGGLTWEPLQIAVDRGDWGELPEKFNGVSDACILVDKNSDAIYIAGAWMHGVLDDSGKWVNGLTDTSTVWNHQWRNKGSQPGWHVKQTTQFLLVKSTDDGKTWGEPVNLTRKCKPKEWWLWVPAPGNGITLEDGTLVFPTQGRDASGEPFSNITYSKDGGKTWKTSKQALDIPKGTTECAVAELDNGAVMLNMRANGNRGNTEPDNGRVVAVSDDLGEHWVEHSTSRNALKEPTCMASLYKHRFHDHLGNERSLLLFFNPNSTSYRENLTLKVSLDDGNSWPKHGWILLDEGRSRGYSCITAVDERTIGMLYESSQANLIFQQVSLDEMIRGFNQHN